MPSKSQKVKLGIFMLVSAASILAVLAAFAGFGSAGGSRYHVLTDDAAGLEVGTFVYLRGVRMGRVAELELVSNGPPGVRVELEVDDEVRINSDARAYLEFAGVSGLKMVNVRGGNPGAPPLLPGSRIEIGKTTLEKLTSQGEVMLSRASKLLESTDQLVSSLNETTRKLKPEQVDETLKETRQLVHDLARTAAQLNRMVSETREPLRETLVAARSTLEQVDGLGRRSDAVLENLDATIGDLRGVVRDNDGDLRATLDNLREASRSFKLLSRDLRKRPNMLLFSGAPPERKVPE
jgi:phospholipid/cholesterol/gamma-HCH transport system substrate-binding protein